MTVSQLIGLYGQAWNSRETILGLPGGDLSPEESAGDLIARFGLERARQIAAEQADTFPAPWDPHYRIHEILREATDG
jgi:hypothetical protein